MKDIIENATIIYKNGFKKICEAISIKKRGVYIGEIRSINQGKKEFVNYSFIPNDQIDGILYINENGKSKKIEIR